MSEPQNSPSKDQFYRSQFSRVAVIGDFIYSDSGEVSQSGNEYRLTNPINATLAIDLSQSWDITDVEIIENAYGSDSKAALLRQALLIDEESGSFYAWGGHVPYWGGDRFAREPVREKSELWRFEPRGDGRGEWINDTPEEDDNFFSFKRNQNNVAVSTPHTGFIFGGASDDRTTPEHGSPLVGYLAFDFKTKEWSHEESIQWLDGTLYGGGAAFASGLGPNGLVFVFGGTSNLSKKGNAMDPNQNYVSFQTIYFMDPKTRKWYSQKTTGWPQLPESRLDFCFGSVADGSRFDIFIYGGRFAAEGKPTSILSDVFVLSLPGFHWMRVPGVENADRRRLGHSCGVVGNRQLLSWGGLAGLNNWQDPDKFSRGIGIFDMSSLEWKDSYNASAEAYTQNERIKNWYDEGNLEKVNWTSTDVQGLFLPQNSSTPPEPDPEPNSVPLGPIIGGVVGGVIAIALVAGLIWFLRRRRRRYQQRDVAVSAPAEMENTQSPEGKPRYQDQPESRASEMYGGYFPPEMAVDGATVRYEVDGTSVVRDSGR